MSKVNPKNGKRSSQDYANLLFSDSDSDTVPDLKLPPLRGKRQKMKRVSRQVEDNSCSVWNVLKVLVTVILVASIITLGLITFWSLQQIKDLRDQLNSLENKNAGTPDELQLFHSKLLAFNKSIQDLSTGKYGLIALNKSIEDMKKQIESLTTANTQLKNQASDHDGLTAESQSIEASVLKNTVVDLGSEVTRMKNDMDQLKSAKDATSEQIDDLKKRLEKVETISGREGVLSTIPEITQNLVSQLNTTMILNFEQAMAKYSSLEAHVDVIDKVATNLQEQLKNLTAAVQNISQSLHSLTTSSQQQSQEGTSLEGGESSQLVARVMDVEKHLVSLDEIVSQFKNGSATYGNKVEGMQNESSILSELKHDHQDFLVFRTEAFQDIEILNTSLTALNMSVTILNLELNDLTSRVENSMQQMTNVSTSMEQIVTFLEKSREEHDDKSKTDVRDPSSRVDSIPGEDERKMEENHPQSGSELTTAPSDNGSKEIKKELVQQ